MKILVFVANVLIQLAAGAFGFLMLIIVMNGYHEKDATPGMILYIILTIISALGLGAGSIFAMQKLVEKTSLGNFGASAIAVMVLSVIGVVILIISLFAAVLLAEAIRK
jgi:hypothetical protein